MKKLFALALSAMLLTSVSAQAETTKLTIDGSKGKLAAVIQKPQTVQGQQIPMVILMHGFGGSKDGRGGQRVCWKSLPTNSRHRALPLSASTSTVMVRARVSSGR